MDGLAILGESSLVTDASFQTRGKCRERSNARENCEAQGCQAMALKPTWKPVESAPERAGADAVRTSRRAPACRCRSGFGVLGRPADVGLK